MKNYAIVENETGIVKNVSQWDGESEWKPPQGHVAIQSEDAVTGDLYDFETGEFKKP